MLRKWQTSLLLTISKPVHYTVLLWVSYLLFVRIAWYASIRLYYLLSVPTFKHPLLVLLGLENITRLVTRIISDRYVILIIRLVTIRFKIGIQNTEYIFYAKVTEEYAKQISADRTFSSDAENDASWVAGPSPAAPEISSSRTWISRIYIYNNRISCFILCGDLFVGHNRTPRRFYR